MTTISERLDPRDNALNLIRLILAALVIVSHAGPISGLSGDPMLGDVTLGRLAVGGFFAISGYLITQSRFRTGIWTYSWRRFLRIMPGYWVCLAFTAFVAAAIGGAIRGGWTLQTASNFFFSNARMFRGGFGEIGDTLLGLPYPGAWNGSLWTLRYEVSCYAVFGVLLIVGYLRRQKLVFPAIFVASTVFSFAVHASNAVGTAADLALLVPFFAAGATIYIYAERIPHDWRWAAVSFVFLTSTFMTGTAESFAALPFAYLMMWAGISAPKVLRRIGSKNDYSYGTYLYAFPLQQLLVIVGAHEFGLPAYVALSLAATMPFAFLSWHLVEKPANRLKDLWKPKVASVGGAHRASVTASSASTPRG